MKLIFTFLLFIFVNFNLNAQFKNSYISNCVSMMQLDICDFKNYVYFVDNKNIIIYSDKHFYDLFEFIKNNYIIENNLFISLDRKYYLLFERRGNNDYLIIYKVLYEKI